MIEEKKFCTKQCIIKYHACYIFFITLVIFLHYFLLNEKKFFRTFPNPTPCQNTMQAQLRPNRLPLTYIHLAVDHLFVCLFVRPSLCIYLPFWCVSWLKMNKWRPLPPSCLTWWIFYFILCTYFIFSLEILI